MKIKNKKITKKDWFLKKIKNYLENYIEYKYDDEYKIEDEEVIIRFLNYKNNRKEVIDYITSDLADNLIDDCSINTQNFKIDIVEFQNCQIGMIEFTNLFSNLNLKIEHFKLENEVFQNRVIGKNYIWKKIFEYEKEKYEYLSDFFKAFINENAEKILDEVVSFINKKG